MLGKRGDSNRTAVNARGYSVGNRTALSKRGYNGGLRNLLLCRRMTARYTDGI